MCGYTAAIGSVMCIFNTTTCTCQRIRGSIQRKLAKWRAMGEGEDAVETASLLPAYAKESPIDSMIGGFVAGFIVAIPLHVDSHAPVISTSTSPLTSTAIKSQGQRQFLALIQRVRWQRCGQYGVGMAALGAMLHWVAAAPPPAATQTIYRSSSQFFTSTRDHSKLTDS
jgi:hypothetical protein